MIEISIKRNKEVIKAQKPYKWDPPPYKQKNLQSEAKIHILPIRPTRSKKKGEMDCNSCQSKEIEVIRTTDTHSVFKCLKCRYQWKGQLSSKPREFSNPARPWTKTKGKDEEKSTQKKRTKPIKNKKSVKGEKKTK